MTVADQSGRRISWGLRSRVRRLYRSRRQRLLVVPRAVLERRYGSSRIEADDDDRWLRVDIGSDEVIEVGFSGTFRMFGALIDTQWTARRGTVDLDGPKCEFRFDKKAFVARRGAEESLARYLADATTVKLAGRSEVKRLTVYDSPGGRMVELVPLAGTITAVYFPPMPPYTVVMKEGEGEDHLTLVMHLLRL